MYIHMLNTSAGGERPLHGRAAAEARRGRRARLGGGPPPWPRTDRPVAVRDRRRGRGGHASVGDQQGAERR